MLAPLGELVTTVSLLTKFVKTPSEGSTVPVRLGTSRLTMWEVALVVGDSHSGWDVVRRQGTDLGVAGAVKDEHFVGVLPKDVEPVPARIGEDIDQGSGHVDNHAALVGFMIVGQDPHRGGQIHARGAAEVEHGGDGAALASHAGRVDGNLNRGGRHAARGSHGNTVGGAGDL
jgi:hypothetical protein